MGTVIDEKTLKVVVDAGVAKQVRIVADRGGFTSRLNSDGICRRIHPKGCGQVLEHVGCGSPLGSVSWRWDRTHKIRWLPAFPTAVTNVILRSLRYVLAVTPHAVSLLDNLDLVRDP